MFCGRLRAQRLIISHSFGLLPTLSLGEYLSHDLKNFEYQVGLVKRTKPIDLSFEGEGSYFILLCSLFQLPVLLWMVDHLAK